MEQVKRRGRPKDPDKLYFDKVGLRQRDWDLLEKFLPGGNRTAQIGELFVLVRKFWSNGPSAPPRCPKCGRWVAHAGAECSNHVRSEHVSG